VRGNFLATKFLNSFSLNFNLLIFGPRLVTIWGLERVVLICFVIVLVRLVPLIWYYWNIYCPVCFFFLSLLRCFPRLTIGVDLLFIFECMLAFVFGWLVVFKVFLYCLSIVNFIASTTRLYQSCVKASGLGLVVWWTIEVSTSRMITMNDSNYNIWNTKSKRLLYVKKIHQPVFGIEKPCDTTEE